MDIRKVNVREVIGNRVIEEGLSIRRIFDGSTEKHVSVSVIR